ncbi:MAG: AMP-binding protein [Betaproteobacteria bacterium]|jgi:long-chain acyl-CoA synthetase
MPHTNSFLNAIDPVIRGCVEAMASELQSHLRPGDTVVLAADNSPLWVHADLALQISGITAIPLPGFFTAGQTGHILNHHPVSAIIGDRASVRRIDASLDVISLPFQGWVLAVLPGQGAIPLLPVPDCPSGAKLTFTSGSTGEPKAVVISPEQQWQVADGIAKSLAPLLPGSHLVLLPLAVLLQNVAGVYSSLLSRSALHVPSLAEIGFSGSSGFDPGPALEMVRRTSCETLIVLPHMLRLMVDYMAQKSLTLPSLRYVAVGGSRVSPQLLDAARALGLPAYEGYGLTEACSVVSMNTPWQHRRASVGQPLPHQQLKIAEDGEILIRWSVFNGGEGSGQAWFPTGDLGAVDPEGYLFINGRKKNLIITGFGRNVSPEWPESMLLEHADISQAMVYGDGEPHLSALLVPSHPDIADTVLAGIIGQVNEQLPDYARIHDWKRIRPFTPDTGFMTPNGRLRRNRIAAFYCSQP